MPMSHSSLTKCQIQLAEKETGESGKHNIDKPLSDLRSEEYNFIPGFIGLG